MLPEDPRGVARGVEGGHVEVHARRLDPRAPKHREVACEVDLGGRHHEDLGALLGLARPHPVDDDVLDRPAVEVALGLVADRLLDLVVVAQRDRDLPEHRPTRVERCADVVLPEPPLGEDLADQVGPRLLGGLDALGDLAHEYAVDLERLHGARELDELQRPRADVEAYRARHPASPPRADGQSGPRAFPEGASIRAPVVLSDLRRAVAVTWACCARPTGGCRGRPGSPCSRIPPSP